jgi:hypothetical protein
MHTQALNSSKLHNHPQIAFCTALTRHGGAARRAALPLLGQRCTHSPFHVECAVSQATAFPHDRIGHVEQPSLLSFCTLCACLTLLVLWAVQTFKSWVV